MEETQTRQQGSGAGRNRLRAIGAAAGVAAVLAVAGLGVAGAQPAPAEGDVERAERPAAAKRVGHGGFGPGGRDAVRGEFVVRDGEGFRTMAMQTGEVTEVSSSAITVKSADGFTRTYAVDDNTMVNAGRDGIADVKKGDEVRVHAVLSGGAARATHVADVTAIEAHRRHWAPKPAPGGTSDRQGN